MKSYFIILVTDIVILFAQHVLVLPKRIRMCIVIFFFVYTLLQCNNSNNQNNQSTQKIGAEDEEEGKEHH